MAVLFLLVASLQPVNAGAGIRYRLDVAVEAERPAVLLTAIEKGDQITGALTLNVRISANSLESRYYGILKPVFSNIVIDRATNTLVPKTNIWEEAGCHQRRGVPKITVIGLNAKFDAKPSNLEAGATSPNFRISSTLRSIGLRIPPDELMPGTKLLSGRDDIGEYFETQSKTRQSKLRIISRLYVFNCVS